MQVFDLLTSDGKLINRNFSIVRAEERKRFTNFESTKIEENDVTPIHVEEGITGAFIIWSDGKITSNSSDTFISFFDRHVELGLLEIDGEVEGRRKGTYKPQNGEMGCAAIAADNLPKTLSADAISLIKEVRGADGGRVYLEGGYSTLAQIESATSSVVVDGKSNGGYQGHQIEQYFATLKSGEKVTFYARSVGYSEGYQFDIYSTLKAAKDELVAVEKWNQGWRHTICLECGAEYEASGKVEPGQMGCVRCN